MQGRIKAEMTAALVVYVVLVVIGFVPGMMMGMIFDAPGSEKDFFRWFLFLTYPCFVLTFIITAILARRFFQKGQYKIVRLLNLVPLFWVLWAFFWFYYWGLQG